MAGETEFLVVKNRAYSKLVAAITSGATSLTLTAGEGARFPSTYPFDITIEDEIVQCTLRSTDTLTIARHQQGTSATAHGKNSKVQLNITAKSVNDLNTAVNFIEKYADYGLSFYGKVTTTTDTEHFKVSGLAGLGTGWFKTNAGTPYEVLVVQAGGATPEGEQKAIVAYTSSDGTFQTGAFGAALEVGDEVLIINPLLASLGTKATAAATGAVTTDDYMMAYVKQQVTLLLSATFGLAKIKDWITYYGAKLDSPTHGLTAIQNTVTFYGLKLVDARIGLEAIIVNLGIMDGRLVSRDFGLEAIQNTTKAVLDYLESATHGLGVLKALIETVDTVADGIQTNLGSKGEGDDAITRIAAIITDLSNEIDGLGALKALVDTLEAALGNPTGDMSAVTQGEESNLAAFVKQQRGHTRGHNQSRICLIVPDLANLASDAPNTAIKAELDKIGTVSMLDEASVDGGDECWGFYDLVVVGSDTYDTFTTSNLDDLILIKIPIIVCNSAVADHLKMGTDTTQSASTVNEWCKTIGNRLMYLIFGSTGDKVLFSEATVSDRLDMSDASLTEHLLMTSLIGDTNTTAVVGSLPHESGVGDSYTLNDNTDMPSGRLFAGCFVNADKLTALGTLLLRRVARNFIQVSVSPSITLKANASLLVKIYQDTADMQPKLGTPAADVSADIAAIKTILDTPANFKATGFATETKQDIIDGYHDVPGEDSATDAQVRDVVGKKSDTTGGTSIVSLIKVLTAAIPAMVGTDDAAIVADGWDATLATILDNFTALRIGYLEELDFDLAGAIAALQTDLDNPAQYKATGFSTSGALGTHDSEIKGLLSTIAGYIDVEIGTIITNIGNLDTALGTHDTALGTHDTALTAAKGVIDAIKTILDTPANFMADVSTITKVGPTLAQMNTAHGLLATPAEVASALNTYDAVKRGEATDDKDEIIAAIPAMVGTDGAALVASGWDAALATILDNFNATRIGDLDELADANLPTDVANVKTDTGNIKTQTDKIANKMLFSMDFWSASLEEVQLGDGAAGATVTLPDIVLADLPTNATIVRAILIFKFRMIENTNATANKLNGATSAGSSQVIQIQKSGGSYIDAINFVDDQFSVGVEAREGGDVIIGTIDVSAQVDANQTHNTKWLLGRADLDYLNFNDVQMGLRIWYSV